MHHGTEADGSDAGQGDVVFFFDISCHFGIGILQARPDVLEGVGPHAVVVAVFPLVISGCNRGVVCADQALILVEPNSIPSAVFCSRIAVFASIPIVFSSLGFFSIFSSLLTDFFLQWILLR